MIRFSCPYCATDYRVPDEKSGKKGKCPRCGKSFLVPSPSTTQLESDYELAQPDESSTCPGCSKSYGPEIKLCMDCGIMLATGEPPEVESTDGVPSGQNRKRWIITGAAAAGLAGVFALLGVALLGNHVDGPSAEKAEEAIVSGPWKFRVVSFETTEDDRYVHETPGGSIRLDTEDGQVVAHIVVAIERQRPYTEAEENALKNHLGSEAYSVCTSFFGGDMVLSNSMFNLVFPRDEAGNITAEVTECLMDARVYLGTQMLTPVDAESKSMQRQLTFAFDPTQTRAVLLFTPVPGKDECAGAGLTLSNGQLASVEYGESKAISRAYLPDELF